jgi:MFS family permease
MNGTNLRLWVMMFLEFFIWGAWFPLIFGYLPSLGFTALEQGLILNGFAIASFAAMFFSNQFADRYFSAEKFLAFSQLVGGLAIAGLYFVKPGWKAPLLGGEVNLSFWAFFGLMLLHSLFYVPTISITNSIAFANVKDPQRDFGLVRLWGTIGWIAAAWPFVFILVDWKAVNAEVGPFGSKPFMEWFETVLVTSKTGDALQQGVRWTFVAAGAASLVLAAFSLILPHTPPKPAVEASHRFAWLQSMRLLAVPYVLVLFVVTFFDAAVHQCYFIWTNDFLKSIGLKPNWVMPVMSVGQIAEILTMAILGLVLKGLGWRMTMVIGILGHAARFGVFAAAPWIMEAGHPQAALWLAGTVNILHGICYAFFFATVYIFVDEFFPKDARASAQGLFNLLILGLGPFVANFVWPLLGEFSKRGQLAYDDRHANSLFLTKLFTGSVSGSVDFRYFFLFPATTALLAALFLMLFFRPPKRAENSTA